MKGKRDCVLTHCLAVEGFGVADRLLFGVDDLLDRDTVRRRGNRFGDTARLSAA